MNHSLELLLAKPFVQTIASHVYESKNVSVSVLRLDAMHDAISGNKWFKLKEHLAAAQQQNKKIVLTFGGAFSNHLLATAAACRLAGFASIGIVRGEKPKLFSHTLHDVLQHGMQLYFIAREDYKNKIIPQEVLEKHRAEAIYIVPEGGYSALGCAGSMGILKSCDTASFTHIIAAVGTGTMLAGLLRSKAKQQQVVGISVLKNNFSIEAAIEKLAQEKPLVLHDYHFGGYAKHKPGLLQFMNAFYESTGIATDFVYTGKTFYAAHALMEQGFFPPQSRILLVHSGGLQGNRSLPQGALGY